MSESTVQKSAIGKKTGITRRGFLKATGAVAGAAALVGGAGAGLALAEDIEGSVSKDEFFIGQCRGNCSGGCLLKIKKRDGKIVQVEMAEQPIPEYNRICSKGLSWPQRTYSTQRVQYPMKRAGERGAGEWVRISWDDAIKEITDKWKQIAEEGSSNDVVFSSGTSTSAWSDVASFFPAAIGASSTAVNYDGALLAMNFRTIGFGQYIYGNDPKSGQNAKTYVMWGANSARSFPHEFHWAFDAMDNGATLISVDPNFGISQSKADIHIPIKPGTDAALLLGLINEVIKNGWQDEGYLLRATVAPYLVKQENGKFMRMSDLGVAPTEGPIDPMTGQPTVVDPILVWDNATGAAAATGTAADPALAGSFVVEGVPVDTAYTLLVKDVEEWPLEKAVEISEVDLDVARDLAKRIALDRPVTVMPGLGPDHYNGGHRVTHALNTLLAVTGNMGSPGAGLSGCCNQTTTAYAAPGMMAAAAFPPAPVIGTVKLTTVFKNKKIGEVPVNIRSILFYGHNALANMSGRLDTLEMLKQLDLIVTMDMEMTETCMWSDYVLPVANQFEYETVMTGIMTPTVVHQDKVIDPLFESKSDYDIFKLLTEAMGVDWPWPSVEDYLQAKCQGPDREKFGITLENLREKGSIVCFENGEYLHGGNDIFPTPTGKMEFYLENVDRSIMWEGMDDGEDYDKSYEHLPHWEPPHEAWDGNPLHEKYPLILGSIRNRYRTHTAFFTCDWLKELAPEPTLRLNPQDAAARGIVTGDYVRAFNDRAEVIMKAEVNNGIRPGMAIYPKGWQEFEHIKGCPANLASNYTNPAAYNNYNCDVLCEVEKWEG